MTTGHNGVKYQMSIITTDGDECWRYSITDDYDSSVLALENRFILNLLANLSQTRRLIVQKKNQIIKEKTLRIRFCN